jgi:hypothetical protein
VGAYAIYMYRKCHGSFYVAGGAVAVAVAGAVAGAVVKLSCY